MQSVIHNDQAGEMRDAWVLRAGAELWKAAIAEADSLAEDTQKALEAVRNALDCARRLRFASEIGPSELSELSAAAARAANDQVLALQQWGRGRGMNWETDWGTQWGEALTRPEGSA